MNLDTTELSHVFPKKSVLVIGDIILDQYTFGEISRISPEAPVPVMQKTSEKFILGGAANVANNIVSLGAKAILVGVVGDDEKKTILFNLLKERGIKTQGIVVTQDRPTIFKNRIVAGDFHQIIRVDMEKVTPLDVKTQQTLLTRLEKEIPKVDIVIFSDYAKGLFSKAFVGKIMILAKKQKKQIIADIKPVNKLFFQGVSLIVPNLKEAEELTGEKNIEKIGQSLVSFFKANIIITMSSEGMMIFPKLGKKKHLPVKKVKVFDVSGAGDTVIAVLALCLSSGVSLENAALLANHAGGIVVQKPGTAVVTLEELLADMQEDHHVERVDIVPKLWGYEKWLENNDKYCCKLLSLKKGYQCSLHYHKEKDEMFFVSKGYVRLESDGKTSYMREGNFTRIAPGTKHRFRGMEDSIIIEVSTHHEESDSYRIEESKKV